MIYLPINLDALVYSLTNLSPVSAPSLPPLVRNCKRNLYRIPHSFFRFFVILCFFVLLVVAPAFCLNWAGLVVSREEDYQSHVYVVS